METWICSQWVGAQVGTRPCDGYLEWGVGAESARRELSCRTLSASRIAWVVQPPAPAPSEPVKNLCVPWTSSGENGTPTSGERGTLLHRLLSRAHGGEGHRTPQRANPTVRAAYLAEGHGEGALWRRSVPGGAILLSAVQLDQGAALRVAGEFAVWRERTKGALVVREMPWGQHAAPRGKGAQEGSRGEWGWGENAGRMSRLPRPPEHVEGRRCLTVCRLLPPLLRRVALRRLELLLYRRNCSQGTSVTFS